MAPESRRRDPGVRRDHQVPAEVHDRKARQRRQRHGYDGGHSNGRISRADARQPADVEARADLPAGQDAISTHEDDRRYRGIADRGITDLAGDEDRAEQQGREAPARSPVDQQEADQNDRYGPGVIGLLHKVPDTLRRQHWCGQHRDHDSGPDHRGQAAAVRPCHGDGAGHDDQVSQRGDPVDGHAVQSGKDVGNRIERQLKRVEGDVAKDPAMQQQVAMEHVPPLEGIVLPVRVHRDAERYPEEQPEQCQAAPIHKAAIHQRRAAAGDTGFSWLAPGRSDGRGAARPEAVARSGPLEY